jgi:aspartate 1-decarboxylase
VHEPMVVLVDEKNRIQQVSKYRAGLLVGAS